MILLLQDNINDKKIYIKENQENMLKEALSNIVYHFTSLQSALNIVKNDTIFLQSPLGSDADNMNTKELFYLSTTRQKSSEFGYSQKFKKNGVRITLDGDLLNHTFKSKPINYWGDSMGKHSYYTDRRDFSSKQHHTDNESEDRLFANVSKIENAHKYIKRIDVVIDKNEQSQLIYAHNIYMSKFAQKVFIYDNDKDFNFQTDNTINQEILNNLDLNDYQNKERLGSGVSSSDLGKIVLLLLIGEVEDKNLKETAAKLLKQYNFERFINKEFFNSLETYWSIEHLVSLVKDILHNFTKRPNETTNRVLSMVNDYFKKHHFRNYRELILYKIDLGAITNYKDEQLYDTNKEINVYTWGEYILGDITKIPFKRIIDDVNTFAENLEMYAREYYTSKNHFHFIEYIKSIINKNISIMDMFKIMKKLRLNDEDIESLMGYKTVKLIKITPYDYYKYKFLDEPENINTFRDNKHKRRFLTLFKK